MQVQFVPCVGARNQTTAKELVEAFQDRGWAEVQSLHRNDALDGGCWFAGNGWWPSTDGLAAQLNPASPV
jgi:protein-L-isoaspartate(D-aspartate) O-methyltransferase